LGSDFLFSSRRSQFKFDSFSARERDPFLELMTPLLVKTSPPGDARGAWSRVSSPPAAWGPKAKAIREREGSTRRYWLSSCRRPGAPLAAQQQLESSLS